MTHSLRTRGCPIGYQQGAFHYLVHSDECHCGQQDVVEFERHYILLFVGLANVSFMVNEHVDEWQRHQRTHQYLIDHHLPMACVPQCVILSDQFLGMHPLEVDVVSDDNGEHQQYVECESKPHYYDYCDYIFVVVV